MDKIYIFWMHCILLTVSVSPSIGKIAPQLHLKWKSVECVPNPSIIESQNCSIVKSDNSLFNSEVVYNQDLSQLHVLFILSMPRPPHDKLRRIFNLDLDFCEFISGTNKNKFVTVAYQAMKRNSNMPKKCPQRKGLYYYRNVNIADYLPDFLPEIDFKVNFNLYVPSTPVLNVTLIGQIRELEKN